MDFDDTPEEAAFRAEARAWLADHAPAAGTRARTASEDDHVTACRAWQRTLYDGRWAGLTWSTDHGGRGATPTQAAIFNQEQARFDVAVGVFAIAIGMVGPTLIAHGTAAQQDRYLPAMLRGEEIWCQLFSEPAAGSDLAALRTAAVRDGDDYVVNGQKVWTSGAHISDFGILLARTDPSRPKSRGISCFIVDMRSAGIDVRPLRQINGRAHFNEVFLTDVRIPAVNMVGEPNDGWRVALTTLTSERVLIADGKVGFGDVEQVARASQRCGDALTRQDLAAAYTRFALSRYLGYRVQTARSQGRAPGPEASIMKLLHSRHMARTADLLLAMTGIDGAVTDGLAQRLFLNQWATRIGGGTDEIQRNLIAERVLGLPRDPSPDHGLPFRDLG